LLSLIPPSSSSDCNENYLEIRKGGANGNLIGVYCGDKKPDTITSSEGYWIKYRTDESSTNNGFLAEYKYMTHSDLQGESGKIESPNYPNYFRKEHVATYRITVQQGSVIRLVFNDFHMDEEDPDDCYSNIQIYNGFDDTAVLLGEEICQEPPAPIISEANIIFVKVRNGLHSKTRFQIGWSRVDRNLTDDSKNSLCGDQIISLNNASTVVNITSPGFPDGYDHNIRCEWTVLSKDPNYHPIIRFTDVDLEDIPNCDADHVKISGNLPDGSWREQEKICMMDIRERKIYHGTPNLKVEFISDYSRNETGFSALVNLNCGGVLTEPDGVIDYDATMASSMRFFSDCMWNITVRRGRKIKFEFLQIDFKNTSDGSTNYVTIKNGHDETAPYLGIGHYNTLSEIPETTSNRAFVMYKISMPFVNTFKLR
jgi:cubilin